MGDALGLGLGGGCKSGEHGCWGGARGVEGERGVEGAAHQGEGGAGTNAGEAAGGEGAQARGGRSRLDVRPVPPYRFQ